MHQSATTARMLHKEPPPNPVASNNNCSVSLVALWITCNSAGPAEDLRSWLWAFRLGCDLGFREPIGQASHLTWKPPGHVVCSVSHSGTWPKGQQLLKHALSRGPPGARRRTPPSTRAHFGLFARPGDHTHAAKPRGTCSLLHTRPSWSGNGTTDLSVCEILSHVSVRSTCLHVVTHLRVAEPLCCTFMCFAQRSILFRRSVIKLF